MARKIQDIKGISIVSRDVNRLLHNVLSFTFKSRLNEKIKAEQLLAKLKADQHNLSPDLNSIMNGIIIHANMVLDYQKQVDELNIQIDNFESIKKKHESDLVRLEEERQSGISKEKRKGKFKAVVSGTVSYVGGVGIGGAIVGLYFLLR